MQLKTEAIVLRGTKYSESDLIINVFSRKLGKIGVYAKNARRLKSPLLSSTQIFSYSMMNISTFDGKYKLVNAELINNYYDISSSYEKTFLAYYFVQFVDRISHEGQTNIKIFELLKNSLENLKGCSNILLQKVIFDTKLIFINGLFPELNSCVECGKAENLGNTFSIANGGRVCMNCNKSLISNFMKLDSTTFRFLDFVLRNSYKTILEANVDASILNELNKLLDDYIDFHFDNLNLSTRQMLVF